MTRVRLLVALSAAVLTIGVASPAIAQSKGKAPRKAKEVPAEPAAKATGERAGSKTDGKAGPRKVVRLEEMRVEGRVQKPQALFVMPRASVNSGEQPDRSESFLSEAKDAVTKDPF